MKRFHVISAAVLAAVLSVGALAEAQGPAAAGRPGRGGPGGRGFAGALPLRSLNLTQAQQDLIRDIRERNRTEMQQIEGKAREARVAQEKAVNAIPFNEAAVRSASLALAEVQADIAVHQARVQSEIFATLTAEQQEAVKKALAAREQGMQQRQSQARERRRENRQ